MFIKMLLLCLITFVSPVWGFEVPLEIEDKIERIECLDRILSVAWTNSNDKDLKSNVISGHTCIPLIRDDDRGGKDYGSMLFWFQKGHMKRLAFRKGGDSHVTISLLKILTNDWGGQRTSAYNMNGADTLKVFFHQESGLYMVGYEEYLYPYSDSLNMKVFPLGFEKTEAGAQRRLQQVKSYFALCKDVVDYLTSILEENKSLANDFLDGKLPSEIASYVQQFLPQITRSYRGQEVDMIPMFPAAVSKWRERTLSAFLSEDHPFDGAHHSVCPFLLCHSDLMLKMQSLQNGDIDVERRVAGDFSPSVWSINLSYDDSDLQREGFSEL